MVALGVTATEVELTTILLAPVIAPPEEVMVKAVAPVTIQAKSVLFPVWMVAGMAEKLFMLGTGIELFVPDTPHPELIARNSSPRTATVP